MHRTFKTASFTKKANKLKVSDSELCQAIEEVRKGQAVDLGGGVYKKRLRANELRSLILAKGGKYWFYQYLFAKSEKENIAHSELEDLRIIAKLLGAMQSSAIEHLIATGKLTEICKYVHSPKI